MASISSDSLDRERRGRIIGEDQHKGAIRARTRELMRLDARRGGAKGTPAAAPGPGARYGGGNGASREAVLKVVSWTKDTRARRTRAPDGDRESRKGFP
jgi:hypothetical protein